MIEYVRGLAQIARYEAERNPSGHRLTEFEAKEAYGPEILAEVNEFGSAVLLRRPGAASDAISTRRSELGLSVAQIASLFDITEEQLAHVETSRERIGIRKLERLALLLGLDERQLAIEEDSGADSDLGVRLRTLSDQQLLPDGTLGLPANAVLRLAESASIIAIAERLRSWLKIPTDWRRFQPDGDYGDRESPAFKAGYRLAAQARKELGLGTGPIASMRSLVEEKLGLTVVQLDLGNRVAGATIANGDARGIVLNVTGENRKPWIRRATLAHELGHLLFDPDERLKRIMIDTYEIMLDTAYQSSRDYVEQRANAFAIAFLAPPEEVTGRFNGFSPQITSEDVASLAQDFGIGLMAARYHIQNAFHQTTDAPAVADGFDPEEREKWEAAENFTLDFFLPESTPIQRRGQISALITSAFDRRLISADTAALYLDVDVQAFQDALPTLRSIWELSDPD